MLSLILMYHYYGDVRRMVCLPDQNHPFARIKNFHEMKHIVRKKLITEMSLREFMNDGSVTYTHRLHNHAQCSWHKLPDIRQLLDIVIGKIIE